MRTAPHERCVQLIKAAGDVVTLTVQSLLAWVRLQLIICICKTRNMEYIVISIRSIRSILMLI